jgi:hypothetical protein
MYWARFDICAAYSHFSNAWRWGYFNNAIAPGDETIRDAVFKYDQQLEALRYQPGLSDSQLRTLSPNAKAIYTSLVKKHLGVRSTAPAEDPADQAEALTQQWVEEETHRCTICGVNPVDPWTGEDTCFECIAKQ